MSRNKTHSCWHLDITRLFEHVGKMVGTRSLDITHQKLQPIIIAQKSAGSQNHGIMFSHVSHTPPSPWLIMEPTSLGHGASGR